MIVSKETTSNPMKTLLHISIVAIRRSTPSRRMYWKESVSWMPVTCARRLRATRQSHQSFTILQTISFRVLMRSGSNNQRLEMIHIQQTRSRYIQPMRISEMRSNSLSASQSNDSGGNVLPCLHRDKSPRSWR